MQVSRGGGRGIWATPGCECMSTKRWPPQTPPTRRSTTLKDSLRFQWQPHGEQASLSANHPISCNRDWPQVDDGPSPDAEGNRTVGTVQISSLAYVYTWPKFRVAL
eukprot:SAG11_NODE_10824_length_803_cov_1.379261_2_plen_105_part_01